MYFGLNALKLFYNIEGQEREHQERFIIFYRNKKPSRNSKGQNNQLRYQIFKFPRAFTSHSHSHSLPDEIKTAQNTKQLNSVKTWFLSNKCAGFVLMQSLKLLYVSFN